jgi:hypothetical protein
MERRWECAASRAEPVSTAAKKTGGWRIGDGRLSGRNDGREGNLDVRRACVQLCVKSSARLRAEVSLRMRMTIPATGLLACTGVFVGQTKTWTPLDSKACSERVIGHVLFMSGRRVVAPAAGMHASVPAAFASCARLMSTPVSVRCLLSTHEMQGQGRACTYTTKVVRVQPAARQSFYFFCAACLTCSGRCPETLGN